MPVTSSVTGCSTCSRVFISRKKKLLSCAGDEFDGAGAVVADGLGQRDRLLAHLLARRLVEQRRRRLLDHFLVAALDRAFALAEIDDVAVLVAQHLDLDVARIGDEFLDEHAVVAEGGFRLRLGAGEAFLHFGFAVGDAHALAAAAGGGLDHHRVADFVGDLRSPRRRRSMMPRWPGTVETCAAAAAFFDSILSPIAAMALGFGPMNTMPAASSALGKASRSDRKP